MARIRNFAREATEIAGSKDPLVRSFLATSVASGLDNFTLSLAHPGRSTAAVEQEAILRLHESGWNVAQIQHHFGENGRRLFREYQQARQAINGLEGDMRSLVELAVNETPFGPKSVLLRRLPDIIARHSGDLLPNIEHIRDALTLISEGASNITQLASVLESAAKQHGTITGDPVLTPIVDQTVASAILRDVTFGQKGMNPNPLIHDLHNSLKTYNLPVDSRFRAALEERITRVLDTNRPRSEVPIDALLAIVKRFGLSAELRERITDHDPGPAGRRMEVLGQDILNAFGQRHSEARAALADFNDLMNRSHFTSPNDVVATSHKPDNLGEGFFIFNISSFRIVARIDFATGQARPIWTGTHAEYDKAIKGNTSHVRKRVTTMYNNMYGS